jgi:uncharacterized protein YndB with AHSA1/START domain
MNFTDGDGKDYWARGEYKEVVPPQRLVMTMSGEGADGNIEGTQVTITFTTRGGKTLVIIHQTGMPITQIAGASQGWSESLDKLAVYLAKR